MATVLVEISDDGKGGVRCSLPGEYAALERTFGRNTAAQNAAILVKQQLDMAGVTPCLCCHGEEPSCKKCCGTGFALLEPCDGGGRLMTDAITDRWQQQAGDNDPATPIQGTIALTLTQCAQLRDALFAARFGDGELCEPVFRYLSVEPDVSGQSATVHYAYAQATWDRAKCTTPANDYVRSLIAATPYRDAALRVQYHDYLRSGWSRPWRETAKEDVNAFPVLVLYEGADGRVTGVVMRDCHAGGNAHAELAQMCVKSDEVLEVIAEFRAMRVDECWSETWYKDANVDAVSLDAAIAATPQTSAGQKETVLYRGGEWLDGLWNNPATQKAWHGDEALELRSIADYHGTRVSTQKLKERVGLDVVRAAQTMPGDYTVLAEALPLVGPLLPMGEREADPAVKHLCDWWNSNAPEALRSAGLFRAYIWDEEDRTFISGDPEEPCEQAANFAKNECFSLFEAAGKPTVALVFFRGRQFNAVVNGYTQTYCPNGKVGWSIGAPLEDVDEAYASMVGLKSVRETLGA